MTQSLLRWHLARDNRAKLARFCEKHRTSQEAGRVYKAMLTEARYFTIAFQFDNGGFIEAELRAGDKDKSYSVADHFQVVNYNLGN